MSAVLDTHAVLWYLLDRQSLSDAAFSLIDNAAATGIPVHISSISLIEITYLVERRRIPSHAFDMLIRELEKSNQHSG
jgi:PIN domain nuclease of toxin-antitoxin system